MPDDHVEKLLEHPDLGTLIWHPVLKWWYATIDVAAIRDKEVGIAEYPDREKHQKLVVNFIRWIEPNYHSFIAAVATAAMNFDLIWDDAVDESSLVSMLTIDSVNVYDGVLRVWIDAGGATTDHLLQAKLNEQHEIVEMEM